MGAEQGFIKLSQSPPIYLFLIFPTKPLESLTVSRGKTSSLPSLAQAPGQPLLQGNRQLEKTRQGKGSLGEGLAELESQLGAAPSSGHCCYCLQQFQDWLSAQDALIYLLFALFVCQKAGTVFVSFWQQLQRV